MISRKFTAVTKTLLEELFARSLGWIRMDIEEKKRLHQINFDAYIQYEIIWIVFKSPLISQTLRGFLEKNDFLIFIDEESGMTSGIWVSGPYPKREYNELRETFKPYGAVLPPLSDLRERS